MYDRLLLILSRESMASEWVAHEISLARAKEAKQNRRALFPISLVPYEAIVSWSQWDVERKKDSAKEIRECYIPDFSTWKSHDQYTKGFASLLEALKSADSKPRASA